MTAAQIMLLAITIIILILIVSKLAYRVLAKKVGDCAVEWVDGYLQIEDVQYKNDREAFIKFALPVKNPGKQQCILVDLWGRIHPEGDKYCSVDNNVYVYWDNNRRRDRYWEAVLIKPGDTLVVRGELTLMSEDAPVREVIGSFRHVKIDLYYKYYCRNLINYKRKIITIESVDVSGAAVETAKAPEFVTIDKGQDALPVKTPLLGSNDDVYSVFETYARPHVKEGDIFAICESALAIMEGRSYYVEDVNPGFLATHLNKFFKMDSSLSSPYSLEMGIREVGAFRILFSVFMGMLGKLVGRSGDFYAHAGRAVATIDDCTGTLPPFDKYIVMGPQNPKKSAEEFKKRTGIDMAVVDVNDLGKVDVLGLSDPSTKQRVIDALKTNPQGNANEQTPIALIRKK
jgi:hypothetical protein